VIFFTAEQQQLWGVGALILLNVKNGQLRADFGHSDSEYLAGIVVRAFVVLVFWLAAGPFRSE
jgi:hypothetical protein